LFTIATLVVADFFHVNTDTHMIIDEHGRERYFHGVNVVYKAFPFHPELNTFDPQYSLCTKDFEILKSTGLNVVRLGVMWPGVEPVRGQYNETYIQIMSKLVEDMSQYGIYTLIDFHQDLLSEKFCGEGVPVWAALPKLDDKHRAFPIPIEPQPFIVDNVTGFPKPEDCDKHSWDVYQLTEAASSAYQSLYDNVDGIQDAFALYWKKLAVTFKSSPNVLGYDLMNEPWCGDIFLDPSLVIPGKADKKNLEPMYNKVAAAIREVDTSHMVFFDSVTWDDFSVGFTQVPGGNAYRNMSVLAYHFYTPPNLFIEAHMYARKTDVSRLGCAGMLTEFDIASRPDNINALYETLRTADKYKQSWIGWEYKPYIKITGWGWCLVDEDGSVNLQVAKALSRTYAQAVAGQVVSMNFNNNTAVYALTYTADPSITKPTEIFASSLYHYPRGYTVQLIPEDIAIWKSVSEDEILVEHKQIFKPTNLTVIITPK
jgi:endoglycosylceramidase